MDEYQFRTLDGRINNIGCVVGLLCMFLVISCVRNDELAGRLEKLEKSLPSPRVEGKKDAK